MPDVKLLRLIVQCMYQQRPCGRNLCCPSGSEKGILQQAPANSTPVIMLIDSQSSEQDDRDWLRHAPFQLPGRALLRYRSIGQTEVSNHPGSAIANDVGFGGASFVVFQRLILEPPVQHVLAAGKLINCMLRRQWLRSSQRSHGGVDSSRRTKASFSATGARSFSLNWR